MKGRESVGSVILFVFSSTDLNLITTRTTHTKRQSGANDNGNRRELGVVCGMYEVILTYAVVKEVKR